jgi:glyoxylase-like metal-dependent hydrolase (beta-lactamase superfamily II)
VSDPFVRDFDPEPGRVDPVSPLVRRVLAPNPGRFTFRGTGTYLVGHGEVAVIDPGPDDPTHVAALLDALAGETVTHILVTHTHGDHSPAARALQAATGAPTYGYGPHPPADRAGDDATPVEERADLRFRPDVVLGEGDVVAGTGWTLEALHTPGHISNHLCFALPEESTLFSGDHVMGWSTTVIPPPDGDLGAYLTHLRRLLDRDDRRYLPTHGAPVDDPHPLVRWLVAHRERRTEQILERLLAGDTTIERIVPVLYADVDPALHPAAARSVLAHLRHLRAEGQVAADGDGDGSTATWTLVRR